MNYERYDVLCIDNINYVVVDVINYDNNKYAYLITEKIQEPEKYLIMHEIIKNNEYYFEEVKDKELYNKIINQVAIKNKDLLIELFNNN